MRTRLKMLTTLLLGLLLVGDSHAQRRENGEWPAYGRTTGGQRHSPLKQIQTDNVSRLREAWTYRTGELTHYEGTSTARRAAFEATPVMVDGTLYFCTPTNRVIALDAANGKEKWVYDPGIDLKRGYSETTCRGVSLRFGPQSKPETLYMGTIDGRLLCLHAKDGTPCQGFGNQGFVDLSPEGGPVSAGCHPVTSPPAIIGDAVVVGGALCDNQTVLDGYGVVRAFDAVSGKLRWSWDPIPRKEGDPGYETWKGRLAHRTGAANAWAPLSADPERDLVFVPTSSPSPDYYGGERIGADLYANSVVALRASTGKMVWGFQTVHHDLWDFDVPMQPVLFTLERNGKSTPAVVVGTKQGHIFVLDRESGTPLFDVEERPVPKSDVAGEETSPTQPFPKDLPVFGNRGVGPEDAWGLDDESREAARKWIESLRSEGPFTPPSLRGSIMTPSNVGGFNWGGLSFDPERAILVGATNRVAAVIRLFPREEADKARGGNQRLNLEFAPMRETPFVMTRDYLVNFDKGIMAVTKPPWGTLAAVNLRTGRLAWEVPLGIMLDPARYPDAVNWGSLNLGGPLTTAGGLTFIGATPDQFLRAFDTDSGKLVWQRRLPAAAHSVPMTYELNGRQYLVVTAGGHGKIDPSKLGDYVVAFALDEGQ